MRLHPFFNYYGAKWRTARHYGPPRRDLVIEPFAGAAGYSVYWNPKQVLLIERDPVIAGVWDYLIHAKASEIMRLPIKLQHIDECPAWVCQEARDFIGLWFNTSAQPAKRPGNWLRNEMAYGNRMSKRTANEQPRYDIIDGTQLPYGRPQGAFVSFWGEWRRHSIAKQVDCIRHWRIVNDSYDQAPDVDAHWYIDPPYQDAGSGGYAFNSKQLNYPALARWCKARKGFVQVCENAGADWLPFETLRLTNGSVRGRANRKGNNPQAQARAEVIFQAGGDRLDLASPPARRPAAATAAPPARHRPSTA